MTARNGSTNIFVYGTLRRDTQHQLFHLLARNATFLGEAMVQARLYDLGEYPGMVYPDRGKVLGEVYRVDPTHWDAVIQRLDEYEGCTSSDPEPHEYRRERIEARLMNGIVIPTWAYILNQIPEGLREIKSGNYLEWRAGAGA
jgi:gamma-glutamylcyclotransferase (GGCT)/AIG2-like uncharacterized protein YtfP